MPWSDWKKFGADIENITTHSTYNSTTSAVSKTVTHIAEKSQKLLVFIICGATNPAGVSFSASITQNEQPLTLTELAISRPIDMIQYAIVDCQKDDEIIIKATCGSGTYAAGKTPYIIVVEM